MSTAGNDRAVQGLSDPVGSQLRVRVGVLDRPRLVAVFERLDGARLTLVSAPAGSGKTEAVAAWLRERRDLSVAWVTVERGDTAARELWTSVAIAVDRLRPGIGRPALARLRAPDSTVLEGIDELLRDLAGYAGQMVIVLDDLHHMTDEDGLALLEYAVERLPSSTRVIATSRADPSIRLNTFRSRGILGEVRARELAFTIDEAAAFLDGRGITGLEREDVEALVEHTEGWPAAVVLAGMWLGGMDAPHEQLREFSASNRQVADYLTSEVLEALAPDVRAFLMHTSILRRFTAELCDWVTGANDSAEQLASLEQSNLFLVSLDGHGEWYRYHNLFRELVHTELVASDQAMVADMHRRAVTWCIEHGLIEDALEYAWATGDPSEVADLLQRHYLDLARSAKFTTFNSWLRRIPDPVLSERPLLSASGVLMSMMAAQPAPIRRRYAALAEAGLGNLSPAERWHAQALISLTRGGALDSDLGQALAYSNEAAGLALEHLPEIAVAALATLAYAHYLGGDAALARSTADQALNRPEAAQRPHGVVFAHSVHALLECDAGRFEVAENEALHAVARARELGISGTWSAGIARHALGETLLARGHARDAERELSRAVTLRRAGEPRLDTVHSLIQLARARVACGKLALAASDLEVADQLLSAFSDAGRLPGMAAEVARALDAANAGSARPVEPPSPAELAVLRLMSTDMSVREIAQQLCLSTNTVNTHVRRIYSKLGAHTRDEAVGNARRDGFIDVEAVPTSPPASR